MPGRDAAAAHAWIGHQVLCWRFDEWALISASVPRHPSTLTLRRLPALDSSCNRPRQRARRLLHPALPIVHQCRHRRVAAPIHRSATRYPHDVQPPTDLPWPLDALPRLSCGRLAPSFRRPRRRIKFSHYRCIAQTAEAAKFDMVFLADGIGLRAKDEPPGALRRSHQTLELEPLTLLSALSSVTSHIGLVATASTTYNEPFHIARKWASLDHSAAAVPVGTSSPPGPRRRRATSTATSTWTTTYATNARRSSSRW